MLLSMLLPLPVLVIVLVLVIEWWTWWTRYFIDGCDCLSNYAQPPTPNPQLPAPNPRSAIGPAMMEAP